MSVSMDDLWNVQQINKWLEQEYSKDIAGRPRFRLVFTSGMRTKRKGDIAEFYGAVFLRMKFGIHDMPKYGWMQDRWLLEKLVPFPEPTGVFVEEQGPHYEPLYKFQLPESMGGGYICPTLKAVQFFMQGYMAAQLAGEKGARIIHHTWTEQENKEEMDRIHAVLGWDPEPSYLESQFKFGEAVVSAARPSELG